jgi:hypothetical protein
MAEETKQNECTPWLRTSCEVASLLLHSPGDPSIQSRAVAYYAVNLADPSIIQALDSPHFAVLHIARGVVDPHVFSLVDFIKHEPYYRVLYLFASLRDQLMHKSPYETMKNAINGGGLNLHESDSAKKILGDPLFKMDATMLHDMSDDNDETIRVNSFDIRNRIIGFYTACEQKSNLRKSMARHVGDERWFGWEEQVFGSDATLRLVFRHVAATEPEIIIMVEYTVSSDMEKELVELESQFNCDFNDIS